MPELVFPTAPTAKQPDKLRTVESGAFWPVIDLQQLREAEAMFALDVALKVLERTPRGIADFRQELWRLWQHGPSDLQRSLAEAALQDFDGNILPTHPRE